ncbi:MAG: hypothetical protein WDN08_18025 [Rhizomicrobium sp.]
MTAFRASLALTALLAVAGPALAQAPPEATGAPTPLSAPAAEEPPPAPVEFTPGILGKPAQSGIARGDLGIVDGPPAGTLNDSNGGLGQSLWVNAPRAEVEELLGRVPLVTADPVLRALARRLVLTTSDAPVGPAKRALLTIRIEKLLQGGLIDEAGAIAASIHLDNDPDFARVQADALLYAGRENDVCSELTATRLTAPETFWLQLRAWCFAAGGDAAAAELTQAVLDSQGPDAAFDLLSADVLTGAKKAPAGIEKPTALHIYLLRKAGLPVTNPIAAKLGTAANLLAARDSRNAPADRLSAAARISATGALSPAELLAILNVQAIPADQIAQAQALAAKLPFLPAQSLLHRAAALESRPAEKANLLLAAMAAPDRLPLTAVLHANVLLSLKPDATSHPLLARALILAGKYDAAAALYPPGTPEDTDLAAFRVLIDLAAPSPARDAAAQAAYAWFAKNAAPQKQPSPAAALALGLSDVLRRPMPPDAHALAGTLQGMRWDGTRPPPDAVRKMVEAASQPGRNGEAILRLLDIVGAEGPSDLPADIVIECVRVLSQLGLAGEARVLAVEALALTRAQ